MKLVFLSCYRNNKMATGYSLIYNGSIFESLILHNVDNSRKALNANYVGILVHCLDMTSCPPGCS